MSSESEDVGSAPEFSHRWAHPGYDVPFMVARGIFVVLLAVWTCWGRVPTPAEHLGFVPGEDFKLASFDQIAGYFQKLDAASDRLKLVRFGESSRGKPLYVAFISSAENLRNLDHYREINRRLALGEPKPEEAALLVKEGKAVVWIDSGLHANEVAPAQHAPVLAYRMVTGEDEEIRRIRENVILMQVPVINPDGLDMVVEWYRGNVGTPYELAPLPRLYQKYAGHDNNRDWFMLNLKETREIMRLLFQEWFPHVVYNQHQQPAFPARIFVPPYAEPLNPNVPSPVMEGINGIGAAMKERFAREEKPGAISYTGFDAWWNGGLRTAPAFHNMHGILTETAAGYFATPRTDREEDLPKRFRNGMPTLVPSVFYQRPWRGGRWGVREAIDYMLTADFAILNLAAVRREHFLRKAYHLARASIAAGEQGGPYAYIVPGEQWDHSSAVEMLWRLHWAGIRVHRATSDFEAGGKSYHAGDYVLLSGQPFRPYLMDLLEPQRYPEILGSNGRTKRPYDVTGWTLRMSMGVAVDRVEEPFAAALEEVEALAPPEESLDHRENASFRTTARLLARGKHVRWGHMGKILVKDEAPAGEFAAALYELRRPRVGLYKPWRANIDTGWTEWVFDTFEAPYTVLRNRDIQAGNLRRNYDVVLLANQSPLSILNGYRAGEAARKTTDELKKKAQQRPEFSGGIGITGLAELERFVRDGGTLITFDDATRLPMEYFPLGVRDVSGESRNGKRYSCPGSLIYLTVDNTDPIGFGMPPETVAFSRGGKAFDITLLPANNKGDREIRTLARYADQDLLASGWISGEKAVLGKPILVEARLGKGSVLLFGFRPQFRGQTFATFKLLLNAIYLASAKQL